LSLSKKIIQVRAVCGQGAYYCEDVATLQKKSVVESERWRTPAETEGFTFIREVAEVVSIGIQTEEGLWGWGDCVGVSYAGKTGRESIFRSKDGLKEVGSILAPFLRNKKLTTFREAMNEVNLLGVHRAIKYGISQALLQSVALLHREEMWKTIQREWGITDSVNRVPIQGSSGNNRKVNADKMIVNRLSGLPHGQIDDIASQLGETGQFLLEYADWLRGRIETLGGKDYSPVIHLDVHGAIGKIFNGSVDKIAAYLAKLEKNVAPFQLRIESVLLGESKQQTIEELIRLKNELKRQGLTTELVADEWANTREDIDEFARLGAAHMIHIKMPDLGGLDQSVDAVLGLKKYKVLSLLGGSCVETDLSSRASVHVALATQPTACLAKPGMGIDEALQIMTNEMNRALLLT